MKSRKPPKFAQSGKPGKPCGAGRPGKASAKPSQAAAPAKTRKGAATAPSAGPERLHKRIAGAGLCSRRAAEEWIAQGRVMVNGEIVTAMGTKVGPEDDVRVDGQPLGRTRFHYLVMNKPTGVVTTLSDPQRRRTVAQLLPDVGGVTLKPIGRLDMDTEGLLMFTNDGTFAHRMAHPKYEVEKEYHALVTGVPDAEALTKLREGIVVEGRRTAPADVKIKHVIQSTGDAMLVLILHEGRKRQVRLMCDAIGHPVKTLKRVRLGPIYLDKLPRGGCRMLGVAEIETLKGLVGL